MILLTDDEIRICFIKANESFDKFDHYKGTKCLADFIADEGAKAQLKKVLEWMGKGGDEQCGFYIDEAGMGDNRITEGPTMFVMYMEKKDWQALLKEIENK